LSPKKRSVAQQSAPAKAAVKKPSAPKKASPKKASPKKASPKKASPKKASPKTAAASKATLKKAAPAKVAAPAVDSGRRRGRPAAPVPKEALKAAKLYEKGARVSELVVQFGVQPHVIHRWLRTHNVEPRLSPAGRKPGRPRQEELSPAAVRELQKKAAKAVARYRRGDVAAVIADDLGVAIGRVYHWLRAENVPIRRPGRQKLEELTTARNADAEAMIQNVLKMYNNGMSPRQIMEKTGISKNIVDRWLTERGVAKRPRGQQVGVTVSGKLSGEKAVDKVIEWYQAGRAPKVIAEKIGVDIGTIYSWLRRRGVSLRPRNKK
jgi:transposase